MTAYDNYKDDPFYTFYKKYAFVNENEFVTTDLHLLSANVPNITESFIYIQSNGYNIFGTKFHILNGINNDAEKI